MKIHHLIISMAFIPVGPMGFGQEPKLQTEELTFSKEKLTNVVWPGTQDEKLKKALPLFANYPSSFRIDRQNVGALPTVFIASKSFNLNAFIAEGRKLDNGDGFFTIALSMNVGFIPGTEKFTGEGDPDDLAKMEKAGWKNIQRHRVDANGVPVFESTFEFEGRHVYLAYIALGNSRSALRVTYYHPKVHTDRDTVIWRAFVDGLSGK